MKIIEKLPAALFAAAAMAAALPASADNWNGAAVTDADSVSGYLYINESGADMPSVDFSMTGGTVSEGIYYGSGSSVGSAVISGDMKYSISGGSVLSNGQSADPVALIGAGTYGVSAASTVDIAKDLTINLGGASTVLNGNIIGAAHGAVVRGNVNINASDNVVLGHHATSGNAANIYGVAYGGRVNGNVNISLGNAVVEGCIIGAGNKVNDAAYSGYVGGDVNILVGRGSSVGAKDGASIYGAFRKGAINASAQDYGIVGGSVNITIEGGAKLAGDIYAGIGRIEKGVTVIFSDYDSASVFSGLVSAGARTGSEAGESSVGGKTSLVFSNYADGDSAAKFFGTVEGFSDLAIIDGSNVEFATLSRSVSDMSFETLTLSTDSKLASAVSTGTVVLKLADDFAPGEGSFDVDAFLAENNVSITLSEGDSVENHFALLNSDGERIEAAWNPDGTISFENVPEPAAIAAVFGMFALAFAAWRRRR